ncbi:hypothetical protein [Roseimarinus sediminis]|uniref:hypothetical protein n=1 Tax=Roseimarinus sediminis TaxID=1610899 RepID=UPI003D1DAF1B
MKKTFIKGILAVLSMFWFFPGFAQEIKTRAVLDSNIILIGDQVKLHLEIEFPDSIEFLFPVPADTLIQSVEIVERMQLDSIPLENNRLRLSQDFLITSFDTGRHEIPPFYFSFNFNGMSDSVPSNAAMLHVFTLPKLDSLMNALQGPIDIKDPYEAPVSFKEVAPWIFGTLLLAGLIFLILYAIKRKKNNQPVFAFPQKPKEPAHIIALRELDRIREQKIWQQGNVKQFYSEVTDTLRDYIEDRFGIRAPELTTDEIIAAFKYRNDLIDKAVFDNLVNLLSTADLVKFAKFEPLPDDNNLTLVNAYFFVNQTKLEVKELKPEANDEGEGDEVTLK